MKFEEQEMGIIDTIWKNYGAGFQALKNWIKKSGPNYNTKIVWH